MHRWPGPVPGGRIPPAAEGPQRPVFFLAVEREAFFAPAFFAFFLDAVPFGRLAVAACAPFAFRAAAFARSTTSERSARPLRYCW